MPNEAPGLISDQITSNMLPTITWNKGKNNYAIIISTGFWHMSILTSILLYIYYEIQRLGRMGKENMVYDLIFCPNSKFCQILKIQLFLVFWALFGR